jgi:UDP-galactopyranose mutase
VSNYDVLCFSHLRWNFVFQRPQHLLSRAAKGHRVFYVEEPICDADETRLVVTQDPSTGVYVCVAHLAPDLDWADREAEQVRLIASLCEEQGIDEHVLWFYTPMALPLTRELRPLARVYDCMDELSAFKGAPPELLTLETELLALADVVFTGGHALFEAKQHLHQNIYAVPSSVDKAHFALARKAPPEPSDQAAIPGPRLGFFGVIDERLDIALLQAVASARPDWQFILLGPVVKIDPADLPRLPNIHYLGSKDYRELPQYIGGWDVALLLFAKNEATRFISPTKTPEYLAAGKPVVSTSIRDVVRPYGEQGLARIADTPSEFIAACEAALLEKNELLVRRADLLLSTMSWDSTWERMESLMHHAVTRSRRISGDTFTPAVGDIQEVG